MISGILGKKIGMTQIFKDGKCVSVTVLEAGPCTVLQVKGKDKDGYNALQLGYEEKKKRRSTKKAEVEHCKKHADSTPKKFIKEVLWDGKSKDGKDNKEKKDDDKDKIKAGLQVTVADLKNFKLLDVTGTSKGKGFQGCVKRYGFGGGPKTHGQSDRLRTPGSIGASATPARVFKGKKMPGHMGARKCTVRNVQIVDIDEKNNLIVVKGGIPGPNGGYLVVKRALTDK